MASQEEDEASNENKYMWIAVGVIVVVISGRDGHQQAGTSRDQCRHDRNGQSETECAAAVTDEW